MRDSQRKATAYHEAGHAVAAWRHRMKLRSATIIPASDYSGVVEHQNPLRGIRLDYDGSDRARMRAESAIIISLAGPAAQKRFNPRSWRSYHGASDFELVTDLALRLNGDGNTATAYCTWLSLVADNLVSGSWRFIEMIAQALLVRGALSGDEVRNLIMADMQKRQGTIRIVEDLNVSNDE